MLSILKASAGSGKTYTLTYEYIRLLLGRKDEEGNYRLNTGGNDRHRSILAITFTNKATDEMKQRIVHELAVLAHIERGGGGESPYLAALTECYGCSADELRREAARALRQLLFDFNFFHVSTIDSFFQLILRTFAYEAELEGDYEVDLDTNRAIGNGVDDLFASLNADPDSGESKEMVNWITEYLLDELRSGKSVSLFNRSSQVYANFLRLISSLSDEHFMARFHELMDYLETGKLKAFRKALRHSAEGMAAKAMRLSREALDAMSAEPLPKGNFNRYLVSALVKIAGTGDVSLPGTTIPKIVDGTAQIATKPGLKFFDNGERAEQYNKVMEACRYIVDVRPQVAVVRAMMAKLFVMGLLRGVYQRIEKARAENNVLLLSDTNSLLRTIIGDDDAPFIFERVGVAFRHFLIDEFQDTSRMQWQNLRPLVNESQSTGNDNLIIGDEKQCIYRFRGSEPSLLQSRVSRDVVPPVSVRGNTPQENTNWRSSSDVVLFNNALFATVARLYGFEEIYSNVEQGVAARNKDFRGYISTLRVEGSVAEFKKSALERMISEIKRQLQAGYRGSDIAVLVRGNDDAAMVVDTLIDTFASDEELKPMGLRVISDDAMLVSSAPSVRRVVAVLRAMATAEMSAGGTDADDGDESRRFRMRSELSKLVNRYEHGLGAGLTPGEALEEAVSAGDEAVSQPLDLSSLKCMNLPSLVERIVAHYFPDGTVPEGELMYLLAFEDAVADFCATSNADVQSFLRWWDATGCNSKVASAADGDAVRVMTIHKSKGLEFRCVHLPLLYSPMVKMSSPEWFEPKPLPGVPDSLLPPIIPMVPTSLMLESDYADDYRRLHREQLLDETNVLYVAFTRAVDELIVTYNADSSKAKPVADLPTSSPTAGVMLDTAIRAMGRESDENEWGEPTVAGAAAASKGAGRAIDPDESERMPQYVVTERDDLWNSTRVDTAADVELGRRRGIVLHDILANVDTPADVSKAVARAVRCGALARERRDEVAGLLTEAISAVPEASRWFSAGARVLRERSFVLADGSVIRPDRVVWGADGTVDVIDYKFGAEHKKSYARQVRSYMDALRSMGYSNVRGYVWYVESGRVAAVD